MAQLWLLTGYTNIWEEEILHLVTRTDAPCHLYLRWTDIEERIHLQTKTDRGLAKLEDPDYCFVQWSEVDQEEAGDTILHTFHFNGWTPCTTRWWHFGGTIAGINSPSQSCIFTEHYPGWMTTPIPTEEWALWYFDKGFDRKDTELWTFRIPIFDLILLEEWSS